MMTAAISARINAALTSIKPELPLGTVRDIAFHMTDWRSDLVKYAEFCSHPDDYTDNDVVELLMQFLVHVPNHVAAAAKLYADSPVRDIFGVGAVELDV